MCITLKYTHYPNVKLKSTLNVPSQQMLCNTSTQQVLCADSLKRDLCSGFVRCEQYSMCCPPGFMYS